MKVGDLVRLRGRDSVYGLVVSIAEEKWVGSRCAVVWLEAGFSVRWYACEELEILNGDR